MLRHVTWSSKLTWNEATSLGILFQEQIWEGQKLDSRRSTKRGDLFSAFAIISIWHIYFWRRGYFVFYHFLVKNNFPALSHSSRRRTTLCQNEIEFPSEVDIVILHNKDQQTIAHERNLICCLFLKAKLYWNIAMALCPCLAHFLLQQGRWATAVETGCPIMAKVPTVWSYAVKVCLFLT